MKPKPIQNMGDLPLDDIGNGERFVAKRGQFGPLIGLEKLGCSLVVVPPGKKGWPYHSHQVNEEMYIVLEGEGTLRLGGEEYPVRAGDVVACPTGGPETAHQLINTGETELRYLIVSTMEEPDVCDYPDSGKFMVMAGSAPGGDKARRRMFHVGRLEDARDYWEGEE